MFPEYLLYGMTANEYWHGDPYLCVAFRKKHELEIKRRNEEMWLQGYYNFIAVSTSLSNIHLDGKRHKINQYLEKPIDLFEKTEEEKERQAIKERQKVIANLTAWATAWNIKHGEKGK